MESPVGRGLEAGFEVNRGGGFHLRLSLSIPPGETVALLGPNGAGKTTAVSAIAGLLPIDQGTIRLADRVLDDPAMGTFVQPEERRIGVVFQDYLLFPHLNAIDNIAFGLRSQGIGRDTARARAKDWLQRLGLGALAGSRPVEVSGGQAQQIALARALISEPDMLLLDEPLAALDITTRSQLRRALAQHLEAFSGPRLVITHDAAEAFLLADHIHVIEEGTLTQSGTPEEILLRPRTAYAADLVGSNLLTGWASQRQVDLGAHTLHIASPVEGEVILTIRPNAISVHRKPPEGSARNVWPTRIEGLERLGERVRIRTGPPLPLTAEVTFEGASELRLAEGEEIWLSVKATEIGIRGAGDLPLSTARSEVGGSAD